MTKELDDAVARLAALPPPRPMPRCMMPDGGDCCAEYHSLVRENGLLLTALKEISGMCNVQSPNIGNAHRVECIRIISAKAINEK